MEKPKNLEETWEVVRNLADLTEADLEQQLGGMSEQEIADLRGALTQAQAVGEGEDGGTHAMRSMAQRAGMSYEDFSMAIEKIEKAIEQQGS